MKASGRSFKLRTAIQKPFLIGFLTTVIPIPLELPVMIAIILDQI